MENADAAGEEDDGSIVFLPGPSFASFVGSGFGVVKYGESREEQSALEVLVAAAIWVSPPILVPDLPGTGARPA